MTTAIATASTTATDREKDLWLTLFFTGLLTTVSGLASFWFRPTPLVTWGMIAGCMVAPFLFHRLVRSVSLMGAVLVLGTVFMTGFLGSFVGSTDWVGPLYNQVRWVAPLFALSIGLLQVGFSPDLWRSLRTPWGAAANALLLFLLYAFVSIAYSSAPLTTLGRAVTFAAITFGTGAALWRMVQRVDQVERLLIWLALLMAVVILPGELYMFIPNSIGWHSSGRFRSTFWNPVTFSHLCALLLPLYWWLMVRSKGMLQRGAAATMLLILLINLILAGSRSGALALVVIVPLLSWRFVGQRVQLVLSALLLLTMTLAVAFQTESINQFFTRGADLSNTYQLYSGRFDDWERAVQLWNQSPIFGYGFGSVGNTDATLLNANTRRGPVFSSNTAGLRLSNLYLETLASSGTVGAGLLFYLLFRLYRTLVRTMRSTHSRIQQLMTMMVATFLGGLILNLTETWLVSAGSPFAMYWWFVLFLAMRIATMEQNASRLTQKF